MIHCGDVLEVTKGLPDNHYDAMLSDPPYGLSFMGKEWDKLGDIGRNRRKAIQKTSKGSIMGAKLETPRIVRSRRRKCLRCGGYSGGPFKNCECDNPEWEKDTYPQGIQNWYYIHFREVLRVLKPGAFGLVFGGTRTWHRLAVALEDAGFEIRDTLMFLYGSGFPKNYDVSKGIDKAAGAEREVVGSKRLGGNACISCKEKGGTYGVQVGSIPAQDIDITAPATPEAKQWQGYGTALKPSWEPCLLIRKPLDGNNVNNVLKWGTGALNVGGSLISYNGEIPNMGGRKKAKMGGKGYGFKVEGRPKEPNTQGRWPSNLILDEDVAYDLGEVSRYFYCAKASAKERNAGLEGFEEKVVNITEGHGRGAINTSKGDGTGIRVNKPRRNIHPTVKPLSLCKYLATLLLPPPRGNTNGNARKLFVPFSGSGSEMIGAFQAGWDEIDGIELNPEYIKIAEARIEYWLGEMKKQNKQQRIFSHA